MLRNVNTSKRQNVRTSLLLSVAEQRFLLSFRRFDALTFCCLLALMSITALSMLGCNGAQRTGPGADLDVPSYAELAAFHNQRVERLSELYARGNIELRWRDESGRHFEQGDLDFYLQKPRNTAFRVTKLGETYLWFGSNETHDWLFDLITGDQRTLTITRAGEIAQGDPEDALLIPPMLLVELMGLMPLPGEQQPGMDASVEPSSETDAWIVIREYEGSSARLYLDRTSLLPVRVELLTDNGSEGLVSTIQRNRSVTIPGTSTATLPRMGTLIDIETNADTDQAASPLEGTMKIAFGHPTGDLSDQPTDRIFDLGRLIRALRPDSIEADDETLSELDLGSSTR